MFKKLHLKLTLINTAVIAAILFIIFSGIYLFMKNDLIKQSEKVIFSIGKEMPHRPIRLPRQGNQNYFFIETDGNTIFNMSPNTPVSEADLLKLIDKVKNNKGNNGEVEINDMKYRFYKFLDFDNIPMLRIVFYNTEFEDQVLSRLAYTLLSVGLISIVLCFVSSLYLANKALIPIKNAWDKQRAFVADASHELRTPLSVIQTNLDVVMSNTEESVESQSKWLGYIKDESIRMNKLVEDLLFLARSDSDEIKLNKKDFNLDLLTQNTVDSFLPVVNLKNITLESNIERNIIYNGDENKIKQLLEILIDNAIKYNNINGVVKISLTSSLNNVELAISDTGIGIDKIHLDKVFERFYRVDTSRSRTQDGTGLGLSIANSITKEHNGKISVDSKPGEGTIFKVVLPKSKADA